MFSSARAMSISSSSSLECRVDLVACCHEFESACDSGFPFAGMGIIHKLGIDEVWREWCATLFDGASA